jgi:hypothetical protein
MDLTCPHGAETADSLERQVAAVTWSTVAHRLIHDQTLTDPDRRTLERLCVAAARATAPHLVAAREAATTPAESAAAEEALVAELVRLITLAHEDGTLGAEAIVVTR